MTIAETSTALDIPEPTTQVRDEAADVRRHKNFEDVRTAPTSPRAAMLVEMIAEDLGVSEDLVWRVVKTGPEEPDAVRAAREGLLADEWSAFRQALEHPDEPVGTPNFVVECTAFLPERVEHQDRLAGDLVAGVVLAHRLREVRVLHGFRRTTSVRTWSTSTLGRADGRAGCRPSSRSVRVSRVRLSGRARCLRV